MADTHGGIKLTDEPTDGQAPSIESIDGGVTDFTQLLTEEATLQLSQTTTPSSPPIPHQPEPHLSPKPSSPTSLKEDQILLPPCEAIPEPPGYDPRGARPKRHRRPPDWYGRPPTQPQGPLSSRSHSRRTQSVFSLPAMSHKSSHSGRSHASHLSDLQISILDGKRRRDELEELKRQRTEERQLDEQCKSIDEKARAAQHLQEDAHKERESVVRQVEMDRRIRKKEQELQSAQLVSSFMHQNISEDEHPDGAAALIPSSPNGRATSSFYALPPTSRIFTPAPPRMMYAESRSLTSSTPPPFPQFGFPMSSQTLPMLQPIQQNVPPAQVAPLSISHVSVQTMPSSSHHAAASVTHSALPTHHVPVPPVTGQAPVYTASLPGPVQPSSTSSWPPRQATSFQQPQSVHSRVQTPNSMDLFIASAYGIPRPSLPVFKSGRESEYALLKMALENLLDIHPHLTEQYKYQILLDHLQHPGANKLARSSMHDVRPYSTALRALQERYGQPRLLVQSEIGALLNSPIIRIGDVEALDEFSLSIHALVGMLLSLEGPTGSELRCGSHVDRLLSKLPVQYRDGFVEYCINRGILTGQANQTYSLLDLSTWLQSKSRAKRISERAVELYKQERPRAVKERQPSRQVSSVYLSTSSERDSTPRVASAQEKVLIKPSKPYCPHCNVRDHFLGSCIEFKRLSENDFLKWIKEKGRCNKCGRMHKTDKCTLKRPCNICKEIHLTILHDVNVNKSATVMLISSPSELLYMDKPNRSNKVMLKIVNVCLHNGERTLITHAVLDDGANRSILLPEAVQFLGLTTQPETISLRTVRQDIVQLNGASVSFEISPINQPTERHLINGAFTAGNLGLSEHTYPVKQLQEQYHHLGDVPLLSIDHACPLVLIGSDYAHLITATEPVLMGPPGGPLAIHTRLGWALQGPASLIQAHHHTLSFTQTCFKSELLRNVERLWQIDTLPYVNEKTATRSKQDKLALDLLHSKTVRVEIDGVMRYATPLLRAPNTPVFKAPKEAVLPRLCATERRLSKDPKLSDKYQEELDKLVQSGYVQRIPSEQVDQSHETWYFPHHIVEHNNKHRVVFDCSFEYMGQNLNKCLLPGPTLGPSLLGVLLRFRQHAIAICGDIKGMFHQVRLLNDDKPLLRFIWRRMQPDQEPTVFEWQVLPFGTTCSPCCATYAVQKHVQDHSDGNEEILNSVQHCFYVDNCLQSFLSSHEAKALIDKMIPLLADGGFDIRQWASNDPAVIHHLPPDAKSKTSELWLSKNGDPKELTLGLKWNCSTDILSYKNKSIIYHQPTMRNIYKVLASQYDPLGYLTPFTARAKIIVQDLWKQERGWDNVIKTESLLEKWQAWELELQNLPDIHCPRCYLPPSINAAISESHLHVFCDASERVYGAVSYLQTTDKHHHTHVSFIMARSRIAPKRQLSIPRLELCAALSGAQLANLLSSELTIPLQSVTLWTDSTTVLSWLTSDSCRYKVFVGTRVAEIQTLTDTKSWRYVDSKSNPADDLTRGKTLLELSQPHRWHQGPPFLLMHTECWPANPAVLAGSEPVEELRKSMFCGTVMANTNLPDPNKYSSWDDLMEETNNMLHGAADHNSNLAQCYINSEKYLLQRAQSECFPEEFNALKTNKSIPRSSKLLPLSPEYDPDLGLIRVGGRLRRAAESLDQYSIHPIILDPKHPITKLIIKHYDEKLLHPGCERVLGELRRRYWILRGRQAIRQHQHQCRDCQRWRANPVIPKMADLPPARLRLFKPPFWSTGIDCFGPFTVKIGRRTEKRWGLLFKCLTTRCIHIELLDSMDADTFLMAFRRFVSRRGKPFELLSDCGTNFKAGEAELRNAFQAMAPDLKHQLARTQVNFQFNPPSAPHFGGSWEREIKSIKMALRVVLGNQPTTETVLHTVLIEVEGILNSKPLAYISSDLADPDPVTPNLLLMGRPDSSLPQAIYCSSELLGKRRWRHSQILADQFWSAFIKFYLPNLQARQKWETDKENLDSGQVVMIVDPQLPRASWPIGRITETYPGKDGKVRTTKVIIQGREYIRPVSRIIPLPEITEETK